MALVGDARRPKEARTQDQLDDPNPPGDEPGDFHFRTNRRNEMAKTPCNCFGPCEVHPPKFNIGLLVATPAALAALTASGENALDYVSRHARGDWGTMDHEDCRANDRALIDGGRIFSAYRLKDGTRIWIITEAQGDNGLRESTCVLLPEDY